tara:strand:+ start:394 stop:1680 length:1287 start_codon:yes stop_codon:yes gene_type:complete
MKVLDTVLFNFHQLLSHRRVLRKIALFAFRGPLFNFINPIFLRVFFNTIGKINTEKVRVDVGIEGTKNHINMALNWITVNQTLQPDDGVSSTTTFFLGRIVNSGSFPEVTGYIIKTLFDYANIFNSSACFESALKAADFELRFQNSDGSFPEGVVGALRGPSVFNTGQIVHGLNRAYRESEDEKYLEACIKACNWIIKVQRADGAWRAFNYRNIARTYDSKVSESLLEVARITNDDKYIDAAKRNLNFVISNQKKNGWFYNCDNTIENNHIPLLHLIGYTIDGLLNSYIILHEEIYLESSRKVLEKLLHKFEIEKTPLSGRHSSTWTSSSKSICVTGLAQISLCWSIMYEITEDFRFLNAAFKMNDVLKSMQLKFGGKKIRGSLPGSYPFWGEYSSYAINSWGVKYFIDSLLKEYRIKKELGSIYSKK